MSLFHSIEEGIRGGYRVTFNREQKPTQYISYRPGDKVTRENVIDMFIQSFAFSLGSLEVQKAYLEQLRNYDGFNYMSTFDSYLLEGRSLVLSDEEKSHFLSAYRHIQEHNSDAHRIEEDQDILTSIGYQMEMLMQKERFLIGKVIEREDQVRLRNRRELLPNHGMPMRRERRRLQLL